MFFQAVLDYEEELDKRHKAFEDYRDTTIKRWYEKTKLMSGKMNKVCAKVFVFLYSFFPDKEISKIP